MRSPSSRILFIDNTFTFGGAINALSYLVPELDQRCFEPIVLSNQDQQLLDRLFPGIDARHWPMRLMWVHGSTSVGMRRWPLFGIWASQLWSKLRTASWLLRSDLPAALRLARFAHRKSVDVFHLNNGVEGMLPALLAARLLRIPVVAHSRGPQSTSGAARLYASMVDEWIAVSETMAANLKVAGVESNRITVVHDAIDLARFEVGLPPSDLRSQLGIPAGAPVTGVFGRIIPWKGIREFILAAARVIDAVPNARAVIVGDPSDGSREYDRQVRDLAVELGISDRVVFTGYREDVADLMRLCDVVVHSSIVPEPFGMTVIEAMATGTPVVAANSGGPTEIIEDGRTGILVDPRDTRSLADAIIGLLLDPERAAALAAHGAERARTYYSSDRCAQEVEQVYERVVSSA